MINVTLDIADILKTLKKYKVLLISTILVCTSIAAIYAIWGSRYYVSQSTFRTLELQNIFIPNLNEEIADYNYITVDSNNPERVNMYSFNLLKTTNFAKKTIEKFNLANYFEITEKDSSKALDITLEKYRKDLISFIYDQDSELVTIHTESKTAKLSYDIINYQYELLNNYYKEEFFNHKDKLITFLEERIQETSIKKKIVDQKIKKYDEENSSFELDTKLEVLLTNYFEIFQKKLMNEVDLRVSEAKYGSDSPQTKELAIIDSLFTSQLASFTDNQNSNPALLSFDNIPSHIITHSTLLNEQTLYTNLLSYLNLIYESAKIDRMRYQEVLEIIDEPFISGIPSRPKPVFTIVISFVISLLLTSTLIYNYDLYRRRNLQ